MCVAFKNLPDSQHAHEMSQGKLNIKMPTLSDVIKLQWLLFEGLSLLNAAKC